MLKQITAPQRKRQPAQRSTPNVTLWGDAVLPAKSAPPSSQDAEAVADTADEAHGGFDRAQFAEQLAAWFMTARRDLPWREAQHAHDPYRILVSEVMLQQTTVAAVGPFYRRFLARFPTAPSLAEAPLDEVLTYWAGLGYYQRARSLHACARAIMEKHGGVFPRDLAAVLALPGIGRYTAGAVTSIAFDMPSPIVDANVARVFARVFCLEGDLKTPANQRRLWHEAEKLIGSCPPVAQDATDDLSSQGGNQRHGGKLEGRASVPAVGVADFKVSGPQAHGGHLAPPHHAALHFSDSFSSEICRPSIVNPALMELGALICVPRGPRCAVCPLASFCAAHAAGRENELPHATPKRAIVELHDVCAFMTRQRPDGTAEILLWQRPHEAKIWWRGMWELPRVTLAPGRGAAEALEQTLGRELGLGLRSGARLKTMRHGVTHHAITLECWAAEIIKDAPPVDAPPVLLDSGAKAHKARWYRWDELSALAIPSTMRRLLDWLRAHPVREEQLSLL